MTRNDEPLIPAERVERAIRFIREERVILDADLAKLYGVSTKVLLQAVKRNLNRFPSDFMFQLTGEEAAALRSQFVTLKTGRGQHRKYRPYAFTEQGVAMLSSVLHSERAEPRLCIALRAEIVERRCETGAWSREGMRRTLAVR